MEADATRRQEAKVMKRSARWVMIAAVLISTTAAVPAENGRNVEVTVDGEPVRFERPVLMVDMIFPLLPAEQFLTALGASMDWNQGAQQLTARRGPVTLQMTAGSDQVIVNGAPQNMPYGAQTLSGVPYVPGAATARLLGLEANWEPEDLRLAIAVPVQMPEGEIVAMTLLELHEGPPASLIVRSLDDGSVYRVPLSEGAPVRRGRVEMTPMGASLSDIQPGDLLEIILTEEGTAAGLTATYAQAMGTIAGIENNRLRLEGAQTYSLGEGVSAVGSDGASLHLLNAVGEAAILRLNPETDEVWAILSQRRGSATPPRVERPVIAGFFLPTYYAPLKAGDGLDLRIIGSGGARATVGFGSSGRIITVPEVEPGVYAAAFTVPNGMNLAKEPLTAQISVGGQDSERLSSSTAVLIDTTPPTISDLHPADGSETNQRTPMIRAQFADAGPAGLDPSSLTVAVNGRDILEDATVQAEGFTYFPPGLTPGMQSVSVSISDVAGNTTSRTWHFRVTEEVQAIQAVEHDAGAPLRPGDTLTVTVRVAAVGREARFDIEGVRAGIAMAQVAGAPTYVGTYTVGDADRAANANITVHFTDADGRPHTAVGPVPVSMVGPEIPFAVTTPTDGGRVARRITPEGTAPPGSRIRWTITYRKVILAGEVGSGTAVADNDGLWRADRELNLSIPIVGMADAYTMTAELLGDAGAVRETLTINFRAGD